MDEIEDYKYTGFPLTPAIFSEAASLIFQERTVARKNVIDRVVEYHESNGGTPPRGQVTALAKKSFQDMEAKGVVQKTGAYGFWKFGGGASGFDNLAPEPKLSPAVYAYYYPAYRDLAIANGENHWPHKIGMTRVNASGRIKEQIGTALPESPVISIFENVDNPERIEKAVHAILMARGKGIKLSPGSEWFDTNLSEIEELIKFLSR